MGAKNIDINDISISGTTVARGQDAHKPSDDDPSNATPSRDLIAWCKKWRIDNEKFITFPKNLDCIPRQIENLIHNCEKPSDIGKTNSLLLGEFPAAYFRHMAAQHMGWILPEDGFVKCVCQARLKAWYENAYKTSGGTLQVIKEYACRLAMQNPKHFMTAYIDKTCTMPERYGEKEAAVLLRSLGPSEFPPEKLDRINREMLLRALAHFHNTFPEHPDADRVAFALGVFIWQAAGDQTDIEKRHAYVARSMEILSSLEGSEGELASLASLAMALYSAQKGRCAKANRKLDEIKKKSVVIHTCHP